MENEGGSFEFVGRWPNVTVSSQVELFCGRMAREMWGRGVDNFYNR